MRIAYVTTDEVNPDLAQRWAETCGCTIVPLSPADPLPDGQFDGAIYDLDYLLPPFRQLVLRHLLRGPQHCPAAVHSYNLRQRQARALRNRGVIAKRRLERTLLLRLQREVHRARAAAQAERLVTLPTPKAELRDHSGAKSSIAYLGDCWGQ